MNNKKTLIILLSVLLVLVIALVSVMFGIKHYNEQNGDTSQTEQPSTAKTLINKGANELQSARIHSHSQDYSLSRDASGKLRVDGFGDIEQSEVDLLAIASAMVFIQADETVIENAEDLSIYGFDHPQYIEMTFGDGTTFRFEAGGEAPLGGTYVRVGGENAVYLIEDGVSALFVDKENYINKDLIDDPTYTDEETGKIVIYNAENISISGALREDIILIDDNTDPDPSDMSVFNSHTLASYYNMPCDNVLMSSILSTLLPFSADAAVCANPDNEQLKSYGLDVPRSIIQFEVDSAQHTICLGNKLNGSYYCMVDDVQCVYLVDETLVPWAEITEYDLLAEPAYEPDVTSINTVSFKSEDKQNVYALTVSDMGEGKGISSATMNGEQCIVDDFNNIYNALIESFCPVEKTDEVASETPVLTVEVSFLSNEKVDILKIYDVNATTCKLIINDGAQLYVSREKVKTVLSLMK